MNRVCKVTTLLLLMCYLVSVCWTLDTGHHHRAKRDTFDVIMKKKGLSAAATALIAAGSISKKRFFPIPIPFPFPIMKPPIIEPVPYPFFGMGFAGLGGLHGKVGGFGAGAYHG